MAKLLETKTYGDGEVIAACKLSDLASISERCAHHDGLVTELLVVVEDGLDRLNTGIVLLAVLLLGACLEPVQNAADKRRDEECASFCGADGLDEGEHEGQVAVDSVIALENFGGLDAFPC